MNENKVKKGFFHKNGVQTLIASLICILLGLLVGYIVLLIINPSESFRALLTILENFFYFPRPEIALEYFGTTLVKTAPLLMCTLSVLFAYKAGLFNIGASGQYTVGAVLALYLGIRFQMPWWICLLAALLGGALLGALAGVLKAYLNVNEVISCIMLNWIVVYAANMVLAPVKNTSSGYTLALRTNAQKAIIPSLGLDKLFHNNEYVTIAIPLALLFAILVWFILEKTKLGFELKATGMSPEAARYAGMKVKQNQILTMAISGALAGLGAAFLFLSGIEQWDCTQSVVPSMGFNGIASAFLGGLNPIGSIFASFFTQHIAGGGAYVDKMVYCSQISDLISSFIIYFCGFVLFIKSVLNRNGIRMNRNKKKGGE